MHATKAVQKPRAEKDVLTGTPQLPTVDIIKWITEHQAQLQKNIPLHPAFLEVCTEAHIAPDKKFLELIENVKNSTEEFWVEFRSTLKKTIQIQTQRLWIPQGELSQFIENAVFSSFSRIVKQGLNKKLA